MPTMNSTTPGDKPAVRFHTVTPDEAGQRIDNFLMRILKGMPKSMIYRILRKGEVRVNKGRIKPEYRLSSDDVVRIPPVRVSDKQPTHNAKHVEILSDRILFEDDRLLILNKPAGMAVHGGSGISSGVIEALRAARPQAHYLELVHRLDRETSGCLLIAKKRSMLRALHELLREGRVGKYYLALVQGNWTKKRWIDAPLRKNQLQGGERIVRVSENGKSARSCFRPLEQYPGATLVEVELDTGRTHQIRVHAQHAGHPLAGDDKYGDDAFNEQMKQQGLKRLFLHAHRISLQLPDGKDIDVSTPLDAELRAVLDRLQDNETT